eukprot:3861526-Karenia_brevis.AAC.1
MGQLATAFRPIKQKVVKKPYLPERTKLQVSQLYLFSRGFFHAGAWNNLTKAQQKKVHSTTMSVYRAVLASSSRAAGFKSESGTYLCL